MSPSPTLVAVAAFLNMFSVGTVYALSTVQVELPRLFPDITRGHSLAPFAAACAGLSIGTRLSSSLISNPGSHATTVFGTALWGAALTFAGYFLQQRTWSDYSVIFYILSAIFLGGVGVGFTYLAVIVMVVQGLPDQPLARSAIGPLGFSSGSAACIVACPRMNFNVLGRQELGTILVAGGLVSTSVGLLAFLALPSNANTPSTSSVGNDKSKIATATDARPSFSVLLFFNALPGMAAFSALLPLTASYGNSPHNILSLSMVSLALGGVLAPTVYSLIGARRTFVALFTLRGGILGCLSRTAAGDHPALATAALLVVLFSHGVGFSVLPILVKARNPGLAAFYTAYAQILPAWGAAGIVGAAYQSFCLWSTGSTDGGLVYISILAASVAATIIIMRPSALQA